MYFCDLAKVKELGRLLLGDALVPSIQVELFDFPGCVPDTKVETSMMVLRSICYRLIDGKADAHIFKQRFSDLIPGAAGQGL